MEYTVPKNKKALFFSFDFMLLGIILAMISKKFPYSWLFQLLGIASIVLSIQLLVRFVLSDYRYSITDLDDGSSDFVIYKTQGKRTVKVCHMSLSLVEGIYKSGEKKPQVKSRYNYVQNINAKSVSIVFVDGEELVEVIIESDERLLKEITKRIGLGNGTTNFAM